MQIVVGRVQDFEPGSRRIVTVGKRSIGVFRVGHRFYALNNHCPHQGGPLCVGRTAPWAISQQPGVVGIGDEVALVACPWHGWEYDLATGQSFLGPGEPPVRSYEVSVQPGRLLTGPDAAPADPVPATGALERIPGPYKVETFDVSIEDDYVVVDTQPKIRP